MPQDDKREEGRTMDNGRSGEVFFTPKAPGTANNKGNQRRQQEQEEPQKAKAYIAWPAGEIIVENGNERQCKQIRDAGRDCVFSTSSHIRQDNKIHR